MFYWIPKGQVPRLQAALDSIRAIYPGRVFASDMLIALGKTMHFRTDLRFVESFDSTASTEQEKSLIWRLHVLAWAATHALKIPGDFVECGVFKGFSSAVICKYLDFAKVPRTFYLYDTFSGLAEETSTSEERAMWNHGYMKLDPEKWLNEVKATFAEYPNVRLVPGVVPASFAQALPERIAYLHIDMNSAQAELQALEHLFDRVSPGGVIVFDDYGWVGNNPQAQAESRFLAEKGLPILEVPTGQGVVIKV